MDSSTKNLPLPMQGFTEFTVMFVPGEPSVGEAANTRRVVGLRVVVVVVAGRGGVVAARGVEGGAPPGGVDAPGVGVWACAVPPPPKAKTKPQKEAPTHLGP